MHRLLLMSVKEPFWALRRMRTLLYRGGFTAVPGLWGTGVRLDGKLYCALLDRPGNFAAKRQPCPQRAACSNLKQNNYVPFSAGQRQSLPTRQGRLQ
jgi:hypothetical protein